ncbi:MAG: molybdopterin-dependent oxidoreductase [Deltaproteobacteria bacterium]|nr:molybdopterin-dependent oxidoreductase [Deltaproteobacteria bacterium]
MTNRIDRRRFLQQSAMATAAAAVAVKLGLPGSAQAADGPAGVTWQKAPCRFCGTGCHAMVGTKDGKVVAIRGDRNAAVNKGLLCVKGYSLGTILYGADRLRKPQLRKGGRLVDVTWEEALTAIAKRIKAAPKRFAFYGSGQWTIPEGLAAMKLTKGGLSNNHVEPNARLCMASAVTGFIGTYGVDEPASCFDDLDRCDVFITWGNNPAEMHPILFSRVMDRKATGAKVKIIDIATRKTRTSAQADETLIFTPHTDLAIANGIAHLLLKRGTYNKDFVAKHCAFRASKTPSLKGKATSFADYRRALKPYTPHYVEKISGVPAAKIKMLADLFGDKKLRITSVWCMGMNQHTRGTAINTLVHGIHLLSGHFGREGDGPQSLTGQPAACGTCREVGTLAHALPGGRLVKVPAHRASIERLWNLPAGRLNSKPGYHTIKMWDHFTRDDGDIDTIWVQVTNPAQSMPNLHKLVPGKERPKDKFLIVSDVYPSKTTEIADVVLPSALWVEKNGIFGNSERRTQQWFRQVLPPGEARDDCWQTIAVAHKLDELGVSGMKDKDGKFIFDAKDDKGADVPIWEWKHYYDVNVDRLLYEEYRPATEMKHKNVAPYDVLVKHRGMRWPVLRQEDGSYKETRYRFVEGEDPFVKAGAGIDFYHSTTKDSRAQIWFHPYEAPPEVPDKAYPFWLSTGRVLEHWHTGTMTRRVPQLLAAMPRAYVEVNAKDAAALRIANGDKVLLETRRGKLEINAWIGGRGEPPQGSVFVPFFDENLLINELTLEAFDPISKEPDYKKCAVRIKRIDP